MKEKFIVNVGIPWHEPWPEYFDNFWKHCSIVARKNGWLPITVANRELKTLQGKLIQPSTQGWYLRWDQESSHTAFVLRWA